MRNTTRKELDAKISRGATHGRLIVEDEPTWFTIAELEEFWQDLAPGDPFYIDNWKASAERTISELAEAYGMEPYAVRAALAIGSGPDDESIARVGDWTAIGAMRALDALRDASIEREAEAEAEVDDFIADWVALMPISAVVAAIASAPESASGSPMLEALTRRRDSQGAISHPTKPGELVRTLDGTRKGITIAAITEGGMIGVMFTDAHYPVRFDAMGLAVVSSIA